MGLQDPHPIRAAHCPCYGIDCTLPQRPAIEAQQGELKDGVAAFFLNVPAFTDINQPLYLHVNICN